MRIAVSVDVPDLDRGIAFYGGAFGLAEVARPVPAYVVLAAGDQQLGLFQKEEGSPATPAPGTERRYDRHWTPVHLDLHVDDFEAAVAAVERLGGRVEQRRRPPGRGPVAFCADPFGHGFCVLGPREAE